MSPIKKAREKEKWREIRWLTLNDKSYFWNSLSSLSNLMLMITWHWQRKIMIFRICVRKTVLRKTVRENEDSLKDSDQAIGKLECELKNMKWLSAQVIAFLILLDFWATIDYCLLGEIHNQTSWPTSWTTKKVY